MPDRVNALLLTSKVAVKLPRLLGTKFAEKVIVPPGFSVVGRLGSCWRLKTVLAAARLMLEIVAPLVPVFWIEKVKLALPATGVGWKITTPPTATDTVDAVLVYE